MVGKHLPFGGLGDSGIGAYHGRASFDAFTHRRAVVRRPFWWNPRDRYPPMRVQLPFLKRLYQFLLGR
jgi:aldehyde dehydrogenase (NAD+)